MYVERRNVIYRVPISTNPLILHSVQNQVDSKKLTKSKMFWKGLLQPHRKMLLQKSFERVLEVVTVSCFSHFILFSLNENRCVYVL